MKRIPTTFYAFGCVAVLLLSTIYAQHKEIQIERDINSALRRRVAHQTPCDEAIRQSREILKQQIRLRNMSNSTAQNTRGYDNRDEYDRLTANLY